MIRSLTERVIFLIMISLSGAACSGTKHLPQGEKLYTGAEIRLESDDQLTAKESRTAKSKAKNALRPEPNRKFLGMRPRLWMYMTAGESPRGFFKRWLKKQGEEPVLLSDVRPSGISEVIDAVLFNSGFFKSSTSFRIEEKEKTAEVIYISSVHKPFIIRELTFTVQDSNISRIILNDKENSLITIGEHYDLEVIRNERTRIDELLKNNGYFFFNPDYLLFKADTSEAIQDVTLDLTLKENLPTNALTVYRINNVYIDQEFSLTDIGTSDSIRGSGMKIRPRALERSIHLRKNEIYSRRNHNNTLSRLMSLNNFKFVNIRFTESDTSAAGYLDATVLMTPMLKYTFSSEVDIVSKSNDFIGPRMKLSYTDKNIFKGAEKMKLDLGGSYEVQLSGSNLYSYSFNPQAELIFPRFLVPFNIGANRRIVPHTHFTFSYNYLRRVNYFDLRMFQFSYGFKWIENIRTEHELDPVNISYTSVSNRSDIFNDLLSSNPYLRRSYEEQYIAGSKYSYTYNEQVMPEKILQFFLQLTTEVSGNAISLVKRIAGEEISSENPSSLAGSIYSQYARLSLDGRSYYNFANKTKFAVRLYGGAGLPYGNSSSLPYTRQFFSGGPNSIRAFHINSIGPGTEEQDAESGFLRAGGEIKVEANAEYRFNIYRFVKGALFIDAGNVWLSGSNPSNADNTFSLSGFNKELAVGAGFGFRFDFSFVVLRLDLASPLRKPWLTEDNRWVIDEINFSSATWRRENLILNIAIGYPF